MTDWRILVAQIFAACVCGGALWSIFTLLCTHIPLSVSA